MYACTSYHEAPAHRSTPPLHTHPLVKRQHLIPHHLSTQPSAPLLPPPFPVPSVLTTAARLPPGKTAQGPMQTQLTHHPGHYCRQYGTYTKPRGTAGGAIPGASPASPSSGRALMPGLASPLVSPAKITRGPPDSAHGLAHAPAHTTIAGACAAPRGRSSGHAPAHPSA